MTIEVRLKFVIVGNVSRTFISPEGVDHNDGEVCVFEGAQYTLSLAKQWFAARLSENLAADIARTGDRQAAHTMTHESSSRGSSRPPTPSLAKTNHDSSRHKGKKSGIKIVSSEPIIDRKSEFIGHAVRITDISQVRPVIEELLDNKRIARAAHPAIYAYRIAKDVGGIAGKVYEAGQFSLVFLTILEPADEQGRL